MFVTTLRANTLKLIGIAVLSFMIVAALVIFVPTYESTAASESVKYEKVYSNSDRVEFISGFGWQVAQTPIEEVTVSIPSEFDTVYLG